MATTNSKAPKYGEVVRTRRDSQLNYLLTPDYPASMGYDFT